ncbi:MAG: hypothetical protein BECKG1743E_GA0114224_103554, partial [Candidatus Kentron sp. G]
SDHERYPADVKCLGFLYLYVGRYPRNNASRNRWRSDCGPARRDGGKNKDCSELHDAIFAPVVTQGRNSGALSLFVKLGLTVIATQKLGKRIRIRMDRPIKNPHLGGFLYHVGLYRIGIWSG